MEEYDDLTLGPNQDGSLNLSYNDWQDMPHELYQMYRDRLLSLNLSNNRLFRVSNHIEKLTLLKELNVTHNRIETIDLAIGKCIRLRKLDVSSNFLQCLPLELSNCRMLVGYERHCAFPSSM